MRRFLFLNGLALALALATPTAKAGFVPVLTGGAGTNSFTYSLAFTTNAAGTESLQDGDVLTLYDFDAAVTPASVTVVPPNFSVTVQNVGITPGGPLLNPNDNPNVANVTFRYNGPTIVVDTVFTATIGLSGAFATRLGQYASSDTLPMLGSNDQIGNVLVPVPEPSSLALAGIGLAWVFGVVARRRLRAARD